MLTDFQNSFPAGLSSQRATKDLWYFLLCVATLPYDILKIKHCKFLMHLTQ